MAALETTVMSPAGAVISYPGRVPAPEAKKRAAEHLRRQIAIAQTHLEELDNWTTAASRGSQKALTYEEINGYGED